MEHETQFSELVENKLNEAYDMAVDHAIDIVNQRIQGKEFISGMINEDISANDLEYIITRLKALKKETK